MLERGGEMAKPELSAEDREKELTARLQAMEQQLERLSTRLSEGDASGAGSASPATVRDYPPEDIADVSEEVINWASRTALMPRLATLCFLLVVALILRTVADSGIVNKLVGSGLGMSYAAFLMMAGWYSYSRQSLLAPVFAASGAILMSTIVVETHTHFQSLPLVPAYLTLVATGIAMALISRKFDAFTPISVGTISMCFAGAAIDYPNPYFPYLSLVLFAANVLAYFAAQMKRCGWLRWSVVFVSMFMLQLWGLRIGHALRRSEIPPPELAYSLFLPVLAIFACAYFVFALLGVVMRKSERITRFDAALPTVNSLWAFSTAFYVISSGAGDTSLLGAIGVLTAAVLLAISFWLAKRSGEGARGTGVYVFACGVLLAMALPAVVGKLVFSLPIISLLAVLMAVKSRSWGSGSVRLTSYLLHIYSGAALVFVLKGNAPDALGAANIIPAGLLALTMLYQYKWCRLWPPSTGYSFFDSFDSNDRSASLLLLTGLISGFFMMRCSIYQILLMISGTVSPDVFRCAQSVLINIVAVVLILLAYLRQDRQLRNVAILVTIVAGFKVFAYDLLGTHGLPLVFSVFSFGVAVAVESVALGKWPKKSEDKVDREIRQENV